MSDIKWHTISYEEELDTDGCVISMEFTQECEYKNGFLVVRRYEDYLEPNRNFQCMTFVPNSK